MKEKKICINLDQVDIETQEILFIEIQKQSQKAAILKLRLVVLGKLSAYNAFLGCHSNQLPGFTIELIHNSISTRTTQKGSETYTAHNGSSTEP